MRKKILLIGLNYHHYTSEIVRELELQGHEVRFYDIQPGLPWLKVLRKFSPERYQPALDRYHASIVAAERGKSAELVIFIQAHQMSPENFGALKRVHPSAEFVLYNWDAVSNHDYRPYLVFFDRTYTFDPLDAQTLGIHYLPLFCIRAFRELPHRDASGKAVYTVGNIVNPARYEAIKQFERFCQGHGLKFQSYMMASTHAYALLLRRGYFPYDVSLRAIPEADFLELIETSSIVFDFANHRQTGFTMRTIENLCAGKKIITNNPTVTRESFFTSDRIHVFKELDFEGVLEFMDEPLRDPAATFPEFHLDNFLRRLVGH